MSNIPIEVLDDNFLIDKNKLSNYLINQEKKFGGLVKNIKRNKISDLDPRSLKKINKGGMTGGDRMSLEGHNYAKDYSNFIYQWIGRQVVIIEIGILTGIGLAIWADLFPKGSRIIGLDIDLSHFKKNKDNLKKLGAFKKNNVEIYEFDQFKNNIKLIKDILKKDKIDILIDDGFHSDETCLNSFNDFKQFMKKESVYFIEDNNTVYTKLKEVTNYNLPLTIIKNNGFNKWLKKTTGYKQNLENPRSLNEKINWKKLYDRNPLITLTSDKIDVRKYVAKKLNNNSILKPVLQVTDNPEEIKFAALQKPYVIKPNHLSGKMIFVYEKDKINKQEIINNCKSWLKEKYVPHAFEWAYEDIYPRILIEPIIGTKELLKSYKLHMFHNKCELIQVNEGSFKDKQKRTLTMYTPDWKKLSDVKWIYPPSEYTLNKPVFIDKLIKYSEILSESFNYVRIDFCEFNNQIYFEEITHYPTSGHAKIEPVEFDFEIGEKWQIKKK
jgi:hypothetical protein